MGATELELHQLVDLSLRTPEVGVVNFNHLHKLLHAILNHIGFTYDGRNISKGIEAKVASEGRTAPANGLENVTGLVSLDGIEGAENVHKYGKENIESSDKTSYPVEPSTTVINSTSKIQDQEMQRLQSSQRHMENKVSNLEEKLKLLDEFPSNRTIIEKAKQSDPTAQSDAGVLPGIWQFMKINSRLQAAEAAIDRIMSILNDVLGGGSSVVDLGCSVQDLAKELESLKTQMNGSGKASSGMEHREDRKAMGNINVELENRLSELVSKEELKEYVKWPALEDALHVRKEINNFAGKEINDIAGKKMNNIAGKNAHKPKVDVVNFDDNGRESSGSPEEERPKTVPATRTQTPIPTPEVPKTAMTRSEFTQVTSKDLQEDIDVNTNDSDGTYPSPEVIECLRRIGELSDKNAKIELQVHAIEEVLPNKIDKLELDLPEGLKNQLDALQEGLNSLSQNKTSDEFEDVRRLSQENRDKIEAIKRELSAMARQAKQAYIDRPSSGKGVDTEAMDVIRTMLTDIQDKQDTSDKKVDYKVAELIEDLDQKRDHIEALYSYVQKLQDTKADKENVAMEIGVKADKAALDGKVSTSTFDSTFHMLDDGLREALQKMDEYMNEELALKQALKQLSCDMKEKMDEQAFKAMQNYLERRIADIQKSRTMIAREAKVDLTGAAGIKRPLLNSHCISCSRPVEVNIDRNIQPQLPSAHGVKVRRSKGPYISYEMEQIRHFQRTQQPSLQPADKTVSEFVARRPCGGSHTVLHHALRKPARIVSTQLSHVLAANAREDGLFHPPTDWAREPSIIDMLKGSDGHVYKGRYKQAIPPITRRHKHTPSESDLPPLHQDRPSLSRGPRWNSEPQLSRGGDEFQSPSEYAPRYTDEDTKALSEPGPEGCSTPPPTSLINVTPNTKMKSIVTRHALSDQMEPVPAPSPSPPAARENEYQHRIDREEFLKLQEQQQRQQQSSVSQRLFSPRHQRTDPRTAPTVMEQESIPSSENLQLTLNGQRQSKEGGNRPGEPMDGRMSVDSVDNVTA